MKRQRPKGQWSSPLGPQRVNLRRYPRPETSVSLERDIDKFPGDCREAYIGVSNFDSTGQGDVTRRNDAYGALAADVRLRWAGFNARREGD